jgi:hypothetical protein
MILDGLPAHDRERAEKATCAYGAGLLLLQPYLPDLDLMQMAAALLREIQHTDLIGETTVHL